MGGGSLDLAPWLPLASGFLLGPFLIVRAWEFLREWF